MDEETVIGYGFESLNEFYKLISNVDLTSQEKYIAFKEWQEKDGTKVGLLNL